MCKFLRVINSKSYKLDVILLINCFDKQEMVVKMHFDITFEKFFLKISSDFVTF